MDALQAIAGFATIAVVMVAVGLADRAPDGDAIIETIAAQGAILVIPTHPRRAATRGTDCCSAEERAMLECPFAPLQLVHRRLSRLDKLDRTISKSLPSVTACILAGWNVDSAEDDEVRSRGGENVHDVARAGLPLSFG